MSVHVVALINIADRAGYALYEKGFGEVFKKHSGKLIAVDEAPVVKEGEWNWTRTVLLEFPDMDSFHGWYDSDAYRSIAQHRFGSSTASVAVLRGTH